MLLSSQAFAQKIWTKSYTTSGNENLRDILVNQFGVDSTKYPLDGPNGLVRKMKRYNPHVENWNNIPAGTRLYIELPYETKANAPIESGVISTPEPEPIIEEPEVDGPDIEIEEEDLEDVSDAPDEEVQVEDAYVFVKVVDKNFQAEYNFLKESLNETTAAGSNVETSKKNFGGATFRYDYTVSYESSYTKSLFLTSHRLLFLLVFWFIPQP